MFPNTAPRYRILVSVPDDRNLTSDQKAIKSRFLDLLRQDNFEPQIFGELGIPVATTWTSDNLREVLGRCQGVAILALSRHNVSNAEKSYRLSTEYNHFEGAMAIAHKLPIFIAKEAGVEPRGILSTAAGFRIDDVPDNNDSSWLETTNPFITHYKAWRDKVNARHHLFLGYSTKAKSTAGQVKDYLHKLNVKVLDWATDFKATGTILSEIERANKTCLGGIFLFTKDDDLVKGNVVTPAPRDNVVFEAGYFISSKGDERVLIIREDGAKMLADLGGQIYLSLKDRDDIASIHTLLQSFVHDRL